MLSSKKPLFLSFLIPLINKSIDDKPQIVGQWDVPVVMATSDPRVLAARLFAVPLEIPSSHQVASIKFQVTDKHQIPRTTADTATPSYFDMFVERLEPGSDEYQELKGSRLTLVRKEHADKHCSVYVADWNHTDSTVSKASDGDKLVLEARMIRLGNHEIKITTQSLFTLEKM